MKKRKGIEKVLNIGYGWMLLLCIAFPIFWLFVSFVLLLLALATDQGYLLNASIMAFPIFLILCVYYAWSWVIVTRTNHAFLETNPRKATSFKWSFLVAFGYTVAFFLAFSFLDQIFNNLDFTGYVLFKIFNFVIALAALIAYFYTAVITAKALEVLLARAPKSNGFWEAFPYLMLVLVFPFGIPYFNQRITSMEWNDYREEHSKQKVQEPKITPLEEEKDSEQLSAPKTSDEDGFLDKEDPRRFMPK